MKRAAVLSLVALLAAGAVHAATLPAVDLGKMNASIDAEYAARKAEIAKGVIVDPQTGAVVTDDKAYAGKSRTYSQIREEVRQLDAARRQEARRLESTRSGELGSLAKDSGVDPGTMRDTGTAPGEPTSRGIAGDRDITLGKAGDVNKVAAAARAKNYQVVYGEGYIRIKELDTVIWDPPREQRGYANRIAAANDAEYAPAKTVNAQIKKGLPYLGNPPKPDASDAKVREWTQNVSKSTLKAGQVTGADPESQAIFARIKAGEDPEGLLYPVGASPAEKARGLRQFNDQAVIRLGEAYRKSNAATQEVFRKLDEQIAQAERAGKDADASELRQQRRSIEQNEAITEALAHKKDPRLMYEIQHGVRLTQRVDANTGDVYFQGSDGRRVTQEDILANKEASVKRLARSVESDAPRAPAGGAGEPSAGVKTTGRVIGVFGALFGVYHAYEAERQTAAAEGRDIAWTSVGANGVLNVLGVNGAIQAGQALGYETQQGTREYIQRELAACRPPDCDPDDPDFRRLLLIKAVARGTFWGTYEAVKGFPLIGDFVGAPETYLNVVRASGGYESAYSDQLATEFINAATQADQAAAALEVGRRFAAEMTRLAAEADASLARLAKLVAAAEALRAQSEGASKQWDADGDALRRGCEEIRAFSAKPGAMPAAEDNRQVVARLAAVTREAGPVCRAMDRALADQRSGAINAQGVAFRVENGVRAPLARAESEYDAARPAAEAATAAGRQADALMARSISTGEAAAQHLAQATALATRMTSSAAVVDAEVNRLMAANQKFDQLRGRFFDAARGFYSGSADESFKAELRKVAATVAKPKTDLAAALQYSRRAEALHKFAAQFAARAAKPHAACPAMAGFAAAREQYKGGTAPLEAAFAQATDALAKGRACLARVAVPAGPVASPGDLAKALDNAMAGVDREQAPKPPVPAPAPAPAPVASAPSPTPPGIKIAEMRADNGQLISRTPYFEGTRGPGTRCKSPTMAFSIMGEVPNPRAEVCPHGVQTKWYRSGQKQEEGNFIDGVKDGLWTTWCENGTMRQQIGTSVNAPGRFDGPVKSWDCRTGRLNRNDTYRAGVKMTTEEYWENGQLRSRCSYVNGRDEGASCTSYSSDGKVINRK